MKNKFFFMAKYTLEGNVSFYDALYKSLDSDDEAESEENNSDRCLISNNVLSEYAVQLACGHKFNYEPLFHDIKTHKYNFNNLESVNSRLALNEIRCPYCRKKQSSLLPYIPQLDLPKLNGVNHYDPAIKMQHFQAQVKCLYQIPSPNFNPLLPESPSNPTHYPCGHGYATKLHPAYFGEGVPVDNKTYCAAHRSLLIKQFKDAVKAKKAAEKLKAKEEKQQAKTAAKEKAKEEKQKAKEEKLKAKEAAKQEAKAAKEAAKEAAKAAKKQSSK